MTGKNLQEAVDYINKGGYVKHIHLHFNLSANLLHEESEDIPLTETMKNDPFFCVDGKFKPYKGLHLRFSSIIKWKEVYRELEAQYKKFIEVTDGKGDNKHVDFHLWYNLTWPVCIALNLFSIRYRIKTIRYLGIHQMKVSRYKLYRLISWNPLVKYIPATNIDYFLHRQKQVGKYPVVELYCHPNYKEGILLDDSPSYINHERQPLINHLELLKENKDLQFISWEDSL